MWLAMKWDKVVSAEEMSRVEAWDCGRGATVEAFMRAAGEAVALRIRERLPQGGRVAIVIGKGNKGGDGYAAGGALLKRGYEVVAIPLFPTESCSRLNREQAQEFAERGRRGTLNRLHEADWIIDAVLGTGFRGEVEGEVANGIEAINRSGKPVLAIDIPSGIDAGTGAGGVAVQATATVTLGLAKMGLFLGRGWECAGRVELGEIGLSEAAVNEARAIAVMPQWRSLALPPLGRSKHKYERGFVVGFGGSKQLAGAMQLSGWAALHAGAGIVKIASLDAMMPIVPELICQRFDQREWADWIGKAQAVMIGPGMGRGKRAREWLKTHLTAIEQPCVLDADALYGLQELRGWPKQVVLTPHHGEMNSMLGIKGSRSQLEGYDLLRASQEFAVARRAVVVLKGAPTFVLAPGELPVVVPRGDPGMATAGSGDVLTGIIAALLAQGMDLREGAVLGVALHAMAGEAAAREKTSYGFSASDLIAHLPDALLSVSHPFGRGL
jgi:NAD(P)H-hydrate epimerase